LRRFATAFDGKTGEKFPRNTQGTPKETAMSQTADFDPVRVTKRLLRATPMGALATLREGTSNPFCSLVNIGTLPDGSPILLISGLAVHTRNIAADHRVSLLLAEPGAPDPLTAPRISITGTAERLTDSAVAIARRRYLAAHPSAELFVDFADFSFYRIAPETVHLVAGFGRIVDLRGAEVLTDISDAGTLLAAEEGAVAHMNDDHRETMMLYASALYGAAAADWRCAGIDPEGMDMRSGDGGALRVDFPQRVVTPDALRRSLKELADHARSFGGKPN
jgi:heme oxygenase (biliverdin-IX-beta and delta-forming)